LVAPKISISPIITRAFFFLAEVFINKEQEIYAQKAAESLEA